jgi:hypothetical protein
VKTFGTFVFLYAPSEVGENSQLLNFLFIKT